MNVVDVGLTRGRCAVPGCVEDAYSTGICRAHYERRRKHGDVGPAHRFKAHWGEGNRRSDGYAKVHDSDHPLAARDGRVYLHRAALYELIGQGPHICTWCGRIVSWNAPRLADALDVDHKDYDRTNDAPDNLVASCHSCNSGRTRRWQRN